MSHKLKGVVSAAALNLYLHRPMLMSLVVFRGYQRRHSGLHPRCKTQQPLLV